MRLTDVRGFALSSPIDPPQDRPFHGGVRRLLKRDAVLVVIETAGGLRGVAPAGASSSAMREYFEGQSHATFADVVAGPVTDALEGAEIETAADAHDLLAAADLPGEVAAKAVSAVDVAVHDLLGKERGVPVYELLADGAVDEEDRRLPLYASAGMYMDPEDYAEQAAALADLDFSGYKYRPGIGVEADRRTADLLTERVGDRMAVMADAHTWWKLGEDYGREAVRSLVETYADRGFYWVEEPVEPDDYAGYRELADLAPLAGGESEPDDDGLLDLLETGAVSFLQGDVRHHRGYTGTMRAARATAGTDCEFVPHNFGTWLGLVANAHLVVAAPGAELLEYPVFDDDPALDGAGPDPGMYPFPLAFDLLAEDLTVDSGAFTVPDGPGLGVTVDLDAVEEYPYVEGPWTEFHYEGS